MIKNHFKSEQYSQRLTQQFRQLRDQILQQQKEQQKTQPTAKLIMLNFNDEYNLPGYYNRIKDFLEDDDAAKERNRKLNEFDDLENNCNNDYRLPDIFYERVKNELEPRANDRETQKIFWLQQAKLYDIEEADYENVYRLIEDIYLQKEEVNSLDENPPQQSIFLGDEDDKKLIQSTKTRKTSAFIEEGEEDHDVVQGDLVEKKGDIKAGPASTRKASSMSIRKESKGENGDQNNLNDSGYESEREEIKKKLEQELIEKELALQEYLDDEQLQQLLDIDSDEDIIFNEKDQIYFFDNNKSPFDDINRIFERRDSLHQQKQDFQKQFQKVIINAYKEKLKRKLYSKIQQNGVDNDNYDDEDDDGDDGEFKFKRRKSQRSKRNSKQILSDSQAAGMKSIQNRGSFGTPQADKTKIQSADKNATTVADKQRTNKKEIDQQLQSADKNAALSKSQNQQSDNKNKPDESKDKDIIGKLIGNQQMNRQQSLKNSNILQTFGQALPNSNLQNPSMMGSFGRVGEIQSSAIKQNKSRALIELLRDELKNEEGFTSDDLMDGGLRSISPQRNVQKSQYNKNLYGQFADKDYKNDEDEEDIDYNEVPSNRYFYSKQLQEYKQDKKQNFIENLKETLKPKQSKMDANNNSDDESDNITDKRKQAKEKRKAALLKSQKLQEQRDKQIKVSEINEINQKLYGCEDRISQLGLKNSPQRSQKSPNNLESQFAQTQIFNKSQFLNQQGMHQSKIGQQSGGSRQMNNADGYQMGQSIGLSSNNFNQSNLPRGNQTGFQLNLQKLQSVNNEQAFYEQQQLYSYLDKQQSQVQPDSKLQSQHYNQMQQQQQLLSAESSFIQTSFMQQLPAENVNTARSNYSQFLFSARQDQNQQQSGSGSKQEISQAESGENQKYERACMLLYSDLKKILQILENQAQKNNDLSQKNLLVNQQRELQDIWNQRNNVTPSLLFMKLGIFRDEKKLKDHIDRMNFYQ